MQLNILERILKVKKEQVQQAKINQPLAKIKAQLGDLAPTRDFAAALRSPLQVALIAEVKAKSPSRGVIKENFNLEDIVTTYSQARVNAISVLTDTDFFGGHPDYLARARMLTDLPLLRKDFIIDPYQIYEARLLGADAVLLLAGVLNDSRLGEFIALARQLGLAALVETHNAAEINHALQRGATIIGINNRDLRNFTVNLNNTYELLSYLDQQSVTVISESGIKTRADVEKLGRWGVHGVLVGETLMAAPDMAAAVRQLQGCIRLNDANTLSTVNK